jgi:hypothetical protein
MSSKLVSSKASRQSIFDRLKSRPNPIFYKQKMQELQVEIDTLSEKNNGSDGLYGEEENEIYQEKLIFHGGGQSNKKLGKTSYHNIKVFLLISYQKIVFTVC